jgi:hypothetical protein
LARKRASPRRSKEFERNNLKTIVVLCSVLVLHGLNSFGQTNAVPRPGYPVPPRRQLQKQNLVAGLNAVSISGISPRASLRRGLEIQPAPEARFRQIDRDGLLKPQISKNDPGAALEAIFQNENDPSGETVIRSPLVTIFPTRR